MWIDLLATGVNEEMYIYVCKGTVLVGNIFHQAFFFYKQGMNEYTNFTFYVKRHQSTCLTLLCTAANVSRNFS